MGAGGLLPRGPRVALDQHLQVIKGLRQDDGVQVTMAHRRPQVVGDQHQHEELCLGRQAVDAFDELVIVHQGSVAQRSGMPVSNIG